MEDIAATQYEMDWNSSHAGEMKRKVCHGGKASIIRPYRTLRKVLLHNQGICCG